MAGKKQISPLEAIQALIKHRSEVPKTEQLTLALLQKFGGLESFATEFHKIYTESKHAQKARMMDKMMSLIQLINQHAKPEGDMSKASDEDLDKTMKLLFEAVSSGQEETSNPTAGGNSEDGRGGSSVPGQAIGTVQTPQSSSATGTGVGKA